MQDKPCNILQRKSQDNVSEKEGKRPLMFKALINLKSMNIGLENR